MTGTGASAPIDLSAGAQARVDEVLTEGSSVALECDPSRCAEQPVHALSVFTAAGVEIGAHMPWVDPGLRFSGDGSLPVGRLAPGRYHFRVWTAAGRVDRRVDVPATGTVTVPL